MIWALLLALLGEVEAPPSIEVEHPDCVLSVGFSPDGLTAASCDNANLIRIWSTSTGRVLRELKGHTSHVASIRFTPDGKFLVSGSYDNTVRVWDVATGEEVWQSGDHGRTVYKVRVSADGRYIATASTKEIILWDLASRTKLRTFPGVDPCAFSPDGRLLAAEVNSTRIAIFDVEKGNEIRRLAPSPKKSVSSLVFTPDGARLVAGLRDGSVTVHEVESGTQLRVMRGHSQSVRGIAISPDGQVIASGSWDTRVKLWELETGHELLELNAHTGYVLSVNFSPEGTRLLSGARDSRAILWDIGSWLRQRAPSAVDATPDNLAGWWRDLGGYDARRAYDALWGLVHAGDAAVDFFSRRPELEAITQPDRAILERLVAELDAPSYAARERAMRRLRAYGYAAQAVLKKARGSKASPEVRRRARELLDEFQATYVWSPADLRAIRVLQALEHIDSAASRELLARLTRTLKPPLAREARYALRRMNVQ